jgi:predicted lipid-binding transport protein (Tim44 family)
MTFMLFAVAIAALFFVGSLIALRLGQHLGLRHRKRSGGEGIGGLATVEGAIFGLMGLLLAFTISGALQRFDDRRQLVIQEATAATTAYDRLSLFGGDEARRLQSSLKKATAGMPLLGIDSSDCLIFSAKVARPFPPERIRK